MADARPSFDELLELVQRQQRLIEALQAEVADLKAQLDDAQRQAKRQAAPFRKGAPKPNPKRPGRKAGDQHGPHGHRPPPPAEQIDEVHEARLPDACPHCAAPVTPTEVVPQFQTEIPRAPLIRKFRVHIGHCESCGKRFPWGYAPVSNCWDSDGPRWFRSEPHVCHHDCSNMKAAAETEQAVH